MRTINYQEQEEQGSQAGIISRVLERMGLSSKPQIQPHQLIISAFRKVLDHRFVMLCDVRLEGLDVVIPLILVGPMGMWVIYPSEAKGIYRAREKAWESFDSRVKDYRAARPNLVLHITLLAKEVEKFLSGKDIIPPTIESVLFFSNPGLHVDSTRPAARIVMADALERFAASIVQGQASLDSSTVQRIVNVLGGSFEPEEIVAGEVKEEHDEFSYQDSSGAKAASPSALPPRAREEPAFAKKVSFTRRQWIIIALLIGFNILILIGLVLFVLLLA